MKVYLDLLRNILEYGARRTDRTGVGTISLFGPQIEMDLQQGFPLLTTKAVHVKSVLYELLWFLRGSTNIAWLNKNGITIWNEWADDCGDLGPVYGKQWRAWPVMDPLDGVTRDFDQIAQLERDLVANPFSRRHIVSAWNVADVPSMKLPPCHTLWQCYVREVGLSKERFLDLKLYARSIDAFLGLPFNIASYAFLTHMLASVTQMTPGRLIISFGDVHIYQNHIDQVHEQLSRTPTTLPTLTILPNSDKPVRTMSDWRYEDFVLHGYTPQPAIKAPIAV